MHERPSLRAAFFYGFPATGINLSLIGAKNSATAAAPAKVVFLAFLAFWAYCHRPNQPLTGDNKGKTNE